MMGSDQSLQYFAHTPGTDLMWQLLDVSSKSLHKWWMEELRVQLLPYRVTAKEKNVSDMEGEEVFSKG